jgi:Tol biopolymer transport system component
MRPRPRGRAAALGGAPRQVSTFGSKPAWSPDGRRLAFPSDPLADIAPTAYGANVPSTIWTVARDGGDLRRLTDSTQPIGGHASPAWSPDGRRIAFVTYSAAPARLWSVAASGGTATLLVEGHIPIHDPVFTPDGTALYYATGAPLLRRRHVRPLSGLVPARRSHRVRERRGPGQHLGVDAARFERVLTAKPDAHGAVSAQVFLLRLRLAGRTGPLFGGA